MGTNLALTIDVDDAQLILQSRGAIFPCLEGKWVFSGRKPTDMESLSSRGIWRINECIARWHNHVLSEGNGKAMNMKVSTSRRRLDSILAVQT